MKSFFMRLIKNPYTKGSFFVTVSSFFVHLINYIFNSLAGRILGPSGYGDLSAFFSYIVILQVPLSVLQSVIIQRISSYRGSKVSYAKAIETFGLATLKKIAPLVFTSALIIPILPRVTNLNPVMSYLIVPVFWLSLISTLYVSFLQGLKLFLAFSLVNIASSLSKLLGIIPPALKWGGGEFVVLTVAVFGALMLPVSRMLAYTPFAHELKQQTDSLPLISKRLRSVIAHPQVIMSFFALFALAIFSNADVIFVKKFFTSAEAGYYGAWSLVSKIVLYVVGPIVGVLYIFFSEKGQTKTKKYVVVLLIGWILVTAVSYVGYTLWGWYGIRMLFGYRYDFVIDYLGLAALFGSFYSLISFLTNYFLALRSRGAYILPLSVPFYIASLFLFGITLKNIMYINLFFTFVASLFAVLYIFKSK